MSLFDIKEDEDLRLQRMLLIYRIIASFEKQIDVSRYVTKSMKIGIKFWDDFLTILDSKVKFCFIVDVLLLGMLDVNLQKSRKNEPCTGKLLRLGVHFRVSTLDFVVCLSAILMLP